MEKIECTSCKQEISQVENYAKFPCPECETMLYRCQKCRTFAHLYKCGCGFKGP